jgi:RNA polymerase sigma-70 factor (ECF subfamily)
MSPISKLPLAAAGIDAVMARSERRLMTEPAFLEFYARTSGPVFGYLRRMIGDSSIAEDLLQDAYVRFLAAASLPEDDAHRKNYLYRIATNLARDYFRRRKVEEIAGPHIGGRADLWPADDQDTWTLLTRLAPRDRELLILAYVEGMTHREIASVTGLVLASVKPLLFRARRRFAAVLTAEGIGPERRPS